MVDGRSARDERSMSKARPAVRMRRDLREVVSGSGSGGVLVAVDGAPVLDLARLRHDHPQAEVGVLDVGSGLAPPVESFSVVIDATRRPDLRPELFDATFPRIPPGGAFFVVDHRPPDSKVSGPAAEDALWPRVVSTGPARSHMGRVVLDEHHLWVERSRVGRRSLTIRGQSLPGVVRSLVDGDNPTIAVVGSSRAAKRADQLRRDIPGAQVVHVGAATSTPRRHARLATHGPFDLMVDATFDDSASAELLRWGFLHLRRGGSLLVLDASPLDGTSNDSSAFWHALSGIVSRRGDQPVYERSPELDWSQLATAIARVDVGSRHVVLTNRVRALAMLRDRQLWHVAQSRNDPAIRVHEREAPLRFTSRATLGEGTKRHPKREPETYRVPGLYLREYRDVFCYSKQLVVKGDLVLPESFRHPSYPWLSNRRLKPLGRLFAGGVRPPTQRLEGTYFHLVGELRHHFGHAMTEQLSRLWAWPAAKALNPDLRALVSIGPRRATLPEWQLALYEAAGVPRTDIVIFREPVIVERLIGATPMFSMPSFVHPGIAEVWDRAGAALGSRAEIDAPPERIFVSRAPALNRWCHETPELERIMTQHGYEVILPERLPLPDQVMLFRRAKAVAGFAGSGMFNLMFAADPKPVLLIRSSGYAATNEYMISSVRGHHLEVIECPPDRASGGNPRAWLTDKQNQSPAIRSPFHFDLDADGERLEQILRALP